jgi:hypothetical protein
MEKEKVKRAIRLDGRWRPINKQLQVARWFVSLIIVASKTKHVRHWSTGEQSQLESDRRARKARAVYYLDTAGYVDGMMRQNKPMLTV